MAPPRINPDAAPVVAPNGVEAAPNPDAVGVAPNPNPVVAGWAAGTPNGDAVG